MLSPVTRDRRSLPSPAGHAPGGQDVVASLSGQTVSILRPNVQAMMSLTAWYQASTAMAGVTRRLW